MTKKILLELGNRVILGMYVDDEGILQLSNPKIETIDLKHYCECCTHTFNGQVY